jgi:hypothetical protein
VGDVDAAAEEGGGRGERLRAQEEEMGQLVSEANEVAEWFPGGFKEVCLSLSLSLSLTHTQAHTPLSLSLFLSLPLSQGLVRRF